MAYKCQNCGKGRQVGHRVSHSKRRTPRVFKPNLHWARVTVGGVTQRMRLCTKCLRKIKAKPTLGLKTVTETRATKLEKRVKTTEVAAPAVS